MTQILGVIAQKNDILSHAALNTSKLTTLPSSVFLEKLVDAQLVEK